MAKLHLDIEPPIPGERGGGDNPLQTLDLHESEVSKTNGTRQKVSLDKNHLSETFHVDVLEYISSMDNLKDMDNETQNSIHPQHTSQSTARNLGTTCSGCCAYSVYPNMSTIYLGHSSPKFSNP